MIRDLELELRIGATLTVDFDRDDGIVINDVVVSDVCVEDAATDLMTSTSPWRRAAFVVALQHLVDDWAQRTGGVTKLLEASNVSDAN